MIPLLIVTTAVSSQLGGKGTADRLIDRYEAHRRRRRGRPGRVRTAPRARARASASLGFLFLDGAVLSFTRAVQRLFEQTWELKPLSVRNTLNGLQWIGGLAVISSLSGFYPFRAGAQPARAGRRAGRRAGDGGVPALVRLDAEREADRSPGSASVRILGAVAARGVLGGRDGVRPGPLQHVRDALRRDRCGVRDDLALFASWSSRWARPRWAARCREELDRIRRGERPAEDEVRRQWDEITADARARWQTVRSKAARGT